ncbi:MAG: phosphotransferase [Clostridia bacterium]|nr:phosphotransferase [Clostridia bacterium]
MERNAELALAAFGMPDAVPHLIRHNENRTYRVDTDRGSFCLRLKSPVEGFDLDVFDGEPEALLRGEIALIESVGRRTDIPVQRPVRTPDGDPVARLPDGTLASLLGWLDGETYKDAETRTAPMLRAAGEALGRLKAASRTLPGLDKIVRCDYGPALIARLDARIASAGDTLPADDITSVRRTLEAVIRAMEADNAAGGRTVAHADPGLGNLVWTGGSAGLIDWSLSGTAPGHMDIGGLMGAVSDREEQRLLLEGYERIAGRTDRRALDACFTLSVLLFVCCQHSRAREWDWFFPALQRWRETIFDPFVEGRPVHCIL